MSLPRYSEYKDSGVEWLGDVPKHWEVVQFKQFVDIQNGSDHKHIEQSEGYPVLGSGGIFTYASDFLYDGESVLLGRKGTINKPLHITGRFWTVDTMYWTKISPDASGRFTYYSALTIPFDYYSTNTALPSMTKGALSSHLVTRPPLTEQIQITAFLDRETGKIDALIAEQKLLVELLAEKRQAVISHAVTKGLNPNAPMTDSGIEWLGVVPVHWEVKKIKHLSIRIASGKTPLGGSEVYVDEGVMFLRSQNIYDEGLRLEDVVYISETVDKIMSVSRVRANDILLNVTGASIGRSCVVPADFQPANVNQHVCVIRLRMISHVPYAGWFFKSLPVKNQIDHAQNGAAREGLNFDQIGNMSITFPPSNEQQAIVSYLDAEAEKFDTLTTEANRAIALLQERRNALISAAVMGKIDVRGFV
jgi:type I restriction enzyme S subunit